MILLNSPLSPIQRYFFYHPWKIEFRLFFFFPCTNGPFGWTLSRSISFLRAGASLNTSFRTFRQRNSILARGNEISSGARRKSPCNKNSSSKSVVHNKNLFLLACLEVKSSLARIYGTRREIGNSGGSNDERRRMRCWIHRGRGLSLLYYA